MTRPLPISAPAVTAELCARWSAGIGGGASRRFDQRIRYGA